MTPPSFKQITGCEKPVILLASKNAGKIKEMRNGLANQVKVIGLDEWEKAHTVLPEPEETENNFFGNALLKAIYYSNATGHTVLADDSGLMIEALQDRPGIMSSRYGGEHLSDAERNQLILAELEGVTDRRAKFFCQLILAAPGKNSLAWNGDLEGLIAEEPAGENGFGYDPIFFHPPSGLTLAQMSPAEKSAISHRGRAIQAMLNDPETGWYPLI